MVNNKKGDNMDQKEKEKCLEVINRHSQKPNLWKNMGVSFLFGGCISILGQFLIEVFLWMGNDLETSRLLMITSLILIASILTALGIYDRLLEKGKAGSFIPITGFANSMTSSAIEYRSEGLIKGIASNMFKMAGSVIVFGVLSSYIIGIIRYFVGLWT